MTMSQCLQDLGAEPELLSDRQRDELCNKGYTLLHGVIDPAWLAALRERFEELIAEEGQNAGLEVHQEDGARRLADLVNKGSVFDRLWSHPLLLAAVRHVIEAPFHFSSLNARDALPGEGLQALHQDAAANPPPYGCNSVWMLDDFRKENGCTRVVPGSYRRPHPEGGAGRPQGAASGRGTGGGPRGQRRRVQLLHLARRYPEPYP